MTDSFCGGETRRDATGCAIVFEGVVDATAERLESEIADRRFREFHIPKLKEFSRFFRPKEIARAEQKFAEKLDLNGGEFVVIRLSLARNGTRTIHENLGRIRPPDGFQSRDAMRQGPSQQDRVGERRQSTLD